MARAGPASQLGALTTSANAVVAKKGSLAYDTSKAAANYLVRRRNGRSSWPRWCASTAWRRPRRRRAAPCPRATRAIASLAKYAIAYADDEPTEQLTEKLAQFYANRTLLKKPITLADQAGEAFFLLLSRRLRQTTGQVITVDGGLHEAFLR